MIEFDRNEGGLSGLSPKVGALSVLSPKVGFGGG